MVPAYRDRPSPLHVARAGVTAAFCGALALVPALSENPFVLLATAVAIVTAGIAAGVGDEIRRAMWLVLPFVLLVTIINPLVYPSGDTLLFRGGEILGRRIDITLEALTAGALAGVRLGVFLLAFALFSACVDPDELLRLFRRVSYRSALTAALATRLVPVLARDASRMSDAARCRPEPPAKLAVTRAALSGALDRAVDVAAALEVRGYSTPGRPARGPRAPWSRHDLRVLAAAMLVAVAAVVAAIAGAAPVTEYPSTRIGFGTGGALLCAVVLAPGWG
jgi:energy-coupling factor transport system permease protein